MKYCSECGQKVEETMKFCSNCGQKLIDNGKMPIEEPKPVIVGESRSSTVVIERADPTFYSDERGVRVTSTRLIIPAKNPNEGPSTYSMANITSVKTLKQEPNRWGGIILAIIGMISIVIGINSHYSTTQWALIGVVLLVLGLAWAILLKPTYHLRIASASGETDALPPETDKEYIDRIVMAINEALIKRG